MPPFLHQQWIEINGLEKLEKNCGYHTENGIPIRRISSTELVIGGTRGDTTSC